MGVAVPKRGTRTASAGLLSRAAFIGVPGGALILLGVLAGLELESGRVWWLGALALGVLVGAVGVLGAALRRHRELAEAASADARRLASASVTSSELVWEMSAEGTLTYLGGQCLAIFGRAPQDLVGTSVFALLPAAEAARARRVLVESVANGTGWERLTFRVVVASGGLEWVQTSGVAHVDEHGAVRGFTATTHLLSAHEVDQLRLSEARARVEQTLAQHAVDIVFQPIVDLSSGQTAGFEALSRFPVQPERSPAEWFADAVLAGHGVELELLAVQTALHRAATRALPLGSYVSVNVSPATLTSPRLVATIDSAPVPPIRIVLEITEHASIADYPVLLAATDVLRQRGVRLAVDDAGAGYASFRHILSMRPDCIKLDQTLVRGIHQDPARRAFAASVVMFALEVGASIVGEGVETAEDLRMALDLGFDAVQGYYLGRPQPQPVSSSTPLCAPA